MSQLSLIMGLRRTWFGLAHAADLSVAGDVLQFKVPFHKYRIESFSGYGPTTNVGAQAKIALYTGPNATGTLLVASVGVSLPPNGINDYTVVLTQRMTVQTAPILYLNCTQGFGAPLKASFYVTVVDFTYCDED